MSHLRLMDILTHEFEIRAARGECDWICSDCSQSFSGGMPDECAHGHQECTEIIQRDKHYAAQQPQGGEDGIN